MKFLKFKFAVFVSLSFMSTASSAQELDYRPGFSVDSLTSNITVEADGTSTTIHEIARTVLTDQGIKQVSQMYIFYSQSMQEAQVIEAYTLRADGKKIDVQSSAIMTKESPASVNAPMFSDYKIKVVVFPELSVGAKLFIKYKLVQKTSLFPGHFFFSDSISPHLHFGSYQVDISVPKSLPLYADAFGIKEEKLPDEGGRIHSRWTGANTTAIAPEPGSVSAFDYAPRLIVSSFKDYASLAKAYQERAHDKAKVTPKVQARAEQITQGLNSQQQKIRALYHWVSKNIRYVAIYFNAGGMVPHEADTILDNRYGDCKDHVVLLEALLSAKGISSSPALINMGNIYSLPKVAGPHVFNHVITYLPEEDLYLDSTAQYAPYGILPFADVGKDVLLTTSGKLSRTPATTAADNFVFSKVAIKVNADGSATGTSDIKSKGNNEIRQRARFAAGMEESSERIAAQWLAQNRENGSGSVNRGEPGNLEKPHVLTSAFKIDSLINLPGPGALATPLGIANTQNENYGNGFTLKSRKFPFLCSAARNESERIITFPAEIKIVSVPKNVEVSNKIGRYTSTYELHSQTMTVRRTYLDTLPSRVCDPADYELNWELARAMQKDARAQILFK